MPIESADLERTTTPPKSGSQESDAVQGNSASNAEAFETSVPRDGRDARWDHHRQRRRNELVDATLRAIRTHAGAPTMDQIAAQAGTKKATLYRYFDDQAGLFSAVAALIDARFLTALSGSVSLERSVDDRVRVLITEYLRLLDDDPEIYRFLEHQQELDSRNVVYPSPQTIGAAANLFADALGLTMTNQLQRSLILGSLGCLRAVADDWMFTDPRDRIALDDLAAALTAMVCHGVTSLST